MRILGETEFVISENKMSNNADNSQSERDELGFQEMPEALVRSTVRRFSDLGTTEKKDVSPENDPLNAKEFALYQSLYGSLFERFRLATWNLEKFSNDRTKSQQIAKVLSVIRPHVLAVQELMSEEAAVSFSQNELLGLYEPIIISHSRNHSVSQVGFFVLKNLPFDLSVKSYYNDARLGPQQMKSREPLFLHDLLILSFYPKGVMKSEPLFSVLNLHLKSPSRASMSLGASQRHNSFVHHEDEALPKIISDYKLKYPTTSLFILGDTNREFSDSDLGHVLAQMGWVSDDGVSTLIGKDLKPIDVALAPDSIPLVGRSTFGDGFTKNNWPSDHKIKTLDFRLIDLLKDYLKTP